jgi:hypothetical protein
VRAIRSKPLASIGDAYCYLGKASQIIIICRNACCLARNGDHPLKVDQSLFDPIMKLKADCPKIEEYLHISQYDLLIDTSRMRLATFTLLTPIRRLPDT